MRPRRCYKAPTVAPVNHVRRSVIISDEENTSEYSHSPSSQHSTLESNPEVPQALKQLKKRPAPTDSDGQSESTDTDSDDPSGITIATAMHQTQCQNNEVLVAAVSRV